MERTVSSRRLFICFCLLLVPQAYSVEKSRKVKGVSLGGWLVVEAWIKHSLFDDIPNPDMLDGTEVQFKSVVTKNYVTALKGGGDNVTVNNPVHGTFETFRLWRVSETQFQFRSSGGQFLSCIGEGCSMSAKAESPSKTETFIIEKLYNRVHFRTFNGTYLQVKPSFQLTADYPTKPGWDDNVATFEMVVVSTDYHGEYQLTNGWGDKAEGVLKAHRDTFVTAEDIRFMSKHGINTLRIPVGWWIYKDPNPPAPYVGGSLEALDNAFKWAQWSSFHHIFCIYLCPSSPVQMIMSSSPGLQCRTYDLKCIIDLHAAPGSQNGKKTSSSRDNSADWATSQVYILQTLDVIDFLASRYAKNPTLLGISLLNNPDAYEIVRKYSSTAYVIITQRTGNADPMENIRANIGSSNLVLETHFFNSDNLTANSSVSDNIEFVLNSRRAEIKALSTPNGPLLFIGEWVNLMTVAEASKDDYQKFGKAQVEVYSEASFGWAYWTLKNKVKHWDLEWNIKSHSL